VGAVRYFRLTAASAVATLALALPAWAQPMAEPAIRAAFLYNFAKFTQWPADSLPAGAPMTLCVMGDGAVAGTLKQLAAGHPIDGHDVRVVAMTADGALRSCQILYVAGNDPQRDSDILGPLRAAPVLTVGDTPRFAVAGGVARVFVDNGRMRFAVNMDAMQRTRLHISSKVLALGLVVKDDGDGTH